MDKILYTRLHRLDHNNAICPNCGKLLKATSHDNGPTGDYDEYHGSWDIWQTCRCKDCKISGNGELDNYSLAGVGAWKFPKGYEITATQKQNNYIKFLATQLDLYYNYISNKDVASEIIKQYLEEYTKLQQRNLDAEKLHSLFEKYGYTYLSHDHCYYQSFPSISVYFYYDESTKELSYRLQTMPLKLPENMDALESIVAHLKQDYYNIKKEIPLLQATTKEEAEAKIESDKEQSKKLYEHHYDYDEYDDYDIPVEDLF